MLQDWIKQGIGFIGVLFIVYIFAAYTVFEFRHPWATETEVFLHSIDALTFQKVPYEQMRPREGGE